jgi:DnaA family protein
MGQIPLSLSLDRHASFANFIAGGNPEALEHVRAIASGGRPEPVWLWGTAGCGRTHLLAAACRGASDAGYRAMYLDVATVPSADMLHGLDDVDCLALDNVELAAGRADAEAALFGVLDARLSGQGNLVMASDRPPRECAFLLPDLASRAGATSVYRLAPLDDEDLLAAIMAHAGSRGLELDEPAAKYLLERVSRDMAEITSWLDRIDRYALAAQRRVTQSLIRQVIAGEVSE